MTNRLTGRDAEIDLSWHRSTLAGLTPAADLCDLPVEDFDATGRLATAARPVLDLLGDDLEDTSLCLILSDRESRLVDIRVGSHSLRNAIERSGAALGRRFDESSTGTNAIATAHELRKPVRVDGAEHYVERLRALSCYGQPIINPVSGAIDGVVTLVRPAGSERDLLGPLARRVARDIEMRLLDGSSREEQRLLAAYRLAAPSKHPVVAIGHEVTFANTAAIDRLGPEDHALLRGYAASIDRLSPERGERRIPGVPLPSGFSVDLFLRRVESTAFGVLIEVTECVSARTIASIATRAMTSAPAGRSSASRLEVRDADLDRWRQERAVVLVGGEPGTGRTTLLEELAAGHSLVVHAGDLVVQGQDQWLSGVVDAVEEARQTQRLLAVEDIQLLPVELLTGVLRQSSDVWRAFSCGPFASLPADHAALVAPILARRELRPLRARTDDIVELTARFAAGNDVRFTSSAVDALAAQPWPGNLSELREVVETVVRYRSVGDIRAVDLPEPYSAAGRVRLLSPLELAERDAISASLRLHAGNKSRVASELGISRTTLYGRIRYFGLPG